MTRKHFEFMAGNIRAEVAVARARALAKDVEGFKTSFNRACGMYDLAVNVSTRHGKNFNQPRFAEACKIDELAELSVEVLK